MNQSHKADGSFCGLSYFEKISTKITNHGSLTSTPSSIFLMVFIALPALQRSQRDTQRRDDMARLATAINQYQTNNNGKLPNEGNKDAVDHVVSGGDWNAYKNCGTGANADACKLIVTYMNSVNANENEFVDPDGWTYGVRIYDNATGVDLTNLTFDHTAHIYKKAECNGENVVPTQNSRDYAIVYRMEGSGIYCKDSR